MKTKRIVITGGPGSGKTTLIDHLEEKGYTCMHEISRSVTKKAQQEGIDQLFLKAPILFSELLLKGRKVQFEEADQIDTKMLFYDRGLPDVTAYMHYFHTRYPSFFDETCRNYRYDMVFLLPPWEAIYQRDSERYESFEEAERIYTHLKDGYTNYQYDVCEVPVGSVEDRIEFILAKILNSR